MDYVSLFRAGCLFCLALFGIPYIRIVLYRSLSQWYKDDAIRITIIIRLITYMLVFVFGISLLQELGVNVTALLGAAGVMGVAVGFAAQTSMSNIISGIFLLIEHPFSIGDEIIFKDFEGEVIDINLFSIILQTKDYRIIRLPHEQVLKDVVINLTHKPRRRYEVQLEFDYKQDIEEVRQTIKNVVKGQNYCLQDHDPVIRVSNVTGDCITLFIGIWVAQNRLRQAKREFLDTLQNTFKKEGIKLHETTHRDVRILQ